MYFEISLGWFIRLNNMKCLNGSTVNVRDWSVHMSQSGQAERLQQTDAFPSVCLSVCLTVSALTWPGQMCTACCCSGWRGLTHRPGEIIKNFRKKARFKKKQKNKNILITEFSSKEHFVSQPSYRFRNRFDSVEWNAKTTRPVCAQMCFLSF